MFLDGQLRTALLTSQLGCPIFDLPVTHTNAILNSILDYPESSPIYRHIAQIETQVRGMQTYSISQFGNSKGMKENTVQSLIRSLVQNYDALMFRPKGRHASGITDLDELDSRIGGFTDDS